MNKKEKDARDRFDKTGKYKTNSSYFNAEDYDNEDKLEGVVECNIIHRLPKQCEERDPHSDECKYCKHNKLNWDEGRFFTSFLEEKQYNPKKDDWTKFKFNKKTYTFEEA